MSEPTPAPPALFTSANALTAARLVLLPVVVFGLAENQGAVALTSMVGAWLTDLADGYVARRQGTVRPEGRTLDTAVDFCFIFGLFIAFYTTGWIPSYQFLILYLTKLTVFFLQVSTLIQRHFRPLSSPMSKTAGALAYAYLLLLGARLVVPAYAFLPLAQLAVFALLTIAVILNGVECLGGVCRQQ